MSDTRHSKIWVRGANWVGDSIMTIPALEALRRACPEAEITLAVRPWVSELFEALASIDKLQIYDRSNEHRGGPGRRRFIRALKETRYDRAILFPNSFEAAYLAWRAGMAERIGYATDGRRILLTRPLKIPRAIFKRHQTGYYLEILRQGGIISEIPEVRSITLPVSESRMQRAQEQLDEKKIRVTGPLIGLNPGAFFGAAKRWFPERYAAVADRLVDAAGGDVIIFGSASERRMADEIAASMRHAPKIFSGETSLAELGALLKKCSLLITNDSGPMHLASAVGTKTLAIFGSTDPVATAPLGSHTRVITQKVSCSPCLLRQCPLDHRCMSRVTVDDVFSAALNLLSQ